MANELQEFQDLLGSLMSSDNDVRTRAEVFWHKILIFFTQKSNGKLLQIIANFHLVPDPSVSTIFPGLLGPNPKVGGL